MRQIFFIIFLLIIFTFITSIGHSDEIQIPFSCYPKQLQSKFSERGYKIDLSANDRDEKSWGFIESKGSKFSIYSYKPISKKELNDIYKIVTEN